MPTKDKIWFAHHLRGVAAIAVLLSHYIFIFWAHTPIAHELTTIPLTLLPKQSSWLKLLSQNLHLGKLGVGLFFLISGFVIPASLQHLSVRQFLITRFFRIYPTYFFGLLISVLSLMIGLWYFQQPFPHQPYVILWNMSLFNEFAGIASIDSVNWTLSIEVVFYIFLAILAALGYLQHGFMWLIFLFLLAMVQLYYAYFISFMLIGCCFYYYHAKCWSGQKTLIMMGLLLAVFSLIALFSPNYRNGDWVGNVYGLILFSTCFFCRNYFSPNRILDFFADISYPLYAVHPIIGYMIMTILWHHYPYPLLIIAITTTLALLLAYVIHLFIELPTNSLGKTLAKKLQ